MAKRDKDTITLGSGEFYYQEFDGTTVPTPETLCVPQNLLGRTKGGAALEYTEETTEEKDDLGRVYKIITTNEEAILKGGLLTWNGNTMSVLIDRASVTEASGKRTTKLGGAGNAKNKHYALCFFHEDTKDGNLWVLIVGRNTAGVTVTFATDAGTVLEPEFKAIPHDEDGTLVQLIEEILTAT